MRSGRVKKSTRPSPRLPKQEILRDIEYSMSIGNLVRGVNSVTVSYLIRYDSLYKMRLILFENATEVYYRMRQIFYYKMRQFYYKFRHYSP